MFLCVTVLAGAVFATARAAEPVKVIWWTNFSGSMFDSIKVLVQQFNDEQDDYEVEVIFQGGASDLMAKLQASTQSELPSAYSGAVEHTGWQVVSEHNVPLQYFIDKDEEGWPELETTFPHLITSYSDGEGNLVGYPFGNSFAGIFVNMDIFKAAGLDPYVELKSFEDIYRIAKILVDGGFAQNGAAFHNNGYYVNAALAVEGVESFNNNNGYDGVPTSALYDQSPTYDALAAMMKAYQDLYAGGYAVPYGTDCNAEVVPMFAEGKLAMFIGVISFHNRILLAGGDKLDLGMVPMPGCSENSRSTGLPAGGTGTYIGNNGNEEAQLGAYKFIKWLSEDQQAAYWATATGYLPVSSSAAATETYQTFLTEKFPRAQYCLDAQAAGDSITRSPFLPIANEVLAANLLMIERVTNDPNYDIDSAIKEANQTINEALELYNLANN